MLLHAARCVWQLSCFAMQKNDFHTQGIASSATLQKGALCQDGLEIQYDIEVVG